MRATLDLLLPPSCACCDLPVASPGQLCGACFRSMCFIAEPLCPRCGLPFGNRAEAGRLGICVMCAASPPPWRQTRAALLYDAAAKRLILPLKYADRQENATTLALHMRRAGAALLAGADLLVPVPLHRWRLLRRRYNQAAELAAALARQTGVPAIQDALVRLVHTGSLGDRSARDREAALQGAIAVRPAGRVRVAGRRVVLIDDVLTSGATARACTAALLDAGAANIDVLVAARVAGAKRATTPPRQAEDYDADD